MKRIHTENAPAAIGPYSQAIDVNGTLYISGQIPFSPETMELVSEDIELQTKQALVNVKAIVEAAGYEVKNIVKCSLFVKDMSDFAKINGVYADFFNDHKPARVAIEAARLPKDVKIEIDAICVK